MKKLKLVTIIGTRPEIIRLSLIIKKCDKFFDHTLIHTGQNYDYELNEIFFKELEIRKPDYFFEVASKSLGDTLGKIISKSYEVLSKIKPDALLVLGDTNSSLSVLPAKRLKIPIFHMEAGNRCFDQRVPEELNRKIVDHLSDINMPLTEQARDYLIAEGLRPETVIKTGSCMKEILLYYKDKIQSSDVLRKLKIKKDEYFIVSSHREENVDYKENLTSFIESLNEVVKTYNLPIIVSTHPRTRQRIEKLKDIKIDDKIQFLKPLGFFDYVNLQQNSKCVISDSGTISEESSILGFPAIMIRAAHERPEGMDEGSVIMSGLKKNRIIESVNMVTKQFESGNTPKIVEDYDVDNVSLKVSRIILSYIDYINRTVWKKDSSTRMV